MFFFPIQIAAVKVKKPFPQITFPSSPLKWWKVKTMHLWTDAEHLTTIQIWSHMVKQQISQTPTQFMNFHGLSCIILWSNVGIIHLMFFHNQTRSFLTEHLQFFKLCSQENYLMTFVIKWHWIWLTTCE
jgi:hypothetical protein